MLTNRLEELWKSADDGASTPVSPITSHSESEIEDLLDAWYLERRNSIEFGILLAQSVKVLGRFVAAGKVSTSDRKRARRLIQVIEATLRTDVLEDD